MNYKSFFIAILIAGLITTSIISSASATCSIPIKYHSAVSFDYNYKYNTNYEHVFHSAPGGKDWETHLTYDVKKPFDTLDFYYTVNGVCSWSVISFFIPNSETLLTIDRMDIYCDYGTLSQYWLEVVITYTDKSTKTFTVDDYTKIGQIKIKYYTI